MALRGADEDDAPWLASAEPDGRETYVSGRRFKLILLLLLALLLLVVGLIYAVIAKPDEGTEVDGGFVGEVPLIRAPDTPFRTRPENAGGMKVEGLDQTTYQAAGGVDPEGDIALGDLPEEPMERPVARPRAVLPPLDAIEPAVQTPPEPPRALETSVMIERKAEVPVVKKPEPKAKPKVIETPKPSNDRLAGVLDGVTPKTAMPSVGSGSYALQLGAFSSNAKADAAWKKISARFSYLAGLSKSVVKVDREEGETLYRLRAAGVESREKADNLCARMRVAGDQCQVVE